MPLLLIRHAVAVARHRWDGDDDRLRPLTERGEEQAAEIVRELRRYGIERILSSPAVRCVDTVRPLAAARGLKVVRDERLFEGDATEAIEMSEKLVRKGASAALCSHGDIIPEVVDALGFRCDRGAKGSTWVIDGDQAVYLPPPA